MTKPIPDKAEIAIEYPNKFYIGTFRAHLAVRRASRCQTGVSLTLERTGDAAEKKAVRMHFHYSLFAEILEELARTASAMPRHDEAHREAMRDAARALADALAEPGRARRRGRDDAERRGPAAAHSGMSGGSRIFITFACADRRLVPSAAS